MNHVKKTCAGTAMVIALALLTLCPIAIGEFYDASSQFGPGVPGF